MGVNGEVAHQRLAPDDGRAAEGPRPPRGGSPRLQGRLPGLPGLDVPEAVFPPAARVAAALYVALAVALVLAVDVEGERAYLETWVLASMPLLAPALVLTWQASRRVSPPDRGFWRLWLWGLVSIWVLGTGVLHVARHEESPVRLLGGAAVVASTAVFDAASLRMMRRRSGRRLLLLDVVEVVMASTVVLGAVTLVIGDRVFGSPQAWFTIPCVMTANGAVTGLVWAVILFGRMPPGDRALEGLGIVLGVAALADSAGQLAQGLSGFTLPSGPLLAVHLSVMGVLLLLPLHGSRLPSSGLGRMPPAQQVRGSRAITVTVLSSLPVLLGLTLAVRDHTPWAGTWLAAVLLTLVVLGSVRNLLALAETKRLYAEVADAADERQRLLADVMRSVDAERQQAAAELHRQAVASYSTFTSFVRGSRSAAGAGGHHEASDRIRSELVRKADDLRQLVQVVRAVEPDAGSADRIAAVLRGHIARVDGAAALHVEVAIDPDLVLDWRTETLVLRLLQTAADAARDSLAQFVGVAVTVGSDGIEVEVQDDGVGLEPTGGRTAIAELGAIVDAAHGSLDVRRRPGRGTTVLARLGAAPDAGALPATGRRVPLRVVPPLTSEADGPTR